MALFKAQCDLSKAPEQSDVSQQQPNSLKLIRKKTFYSQPGIEMTRTQHLVRISLDEIYDGHVLERKCLGKIIETCFVINYKLVWGLAK